MDITGSILLEVIREAQEAKLLKQFLFKKLKGYAGISHSELEVICATFGILEEGDDN